ncbi:jmjc domain-containing protein 7-like [Nannochloropsis oceanica]
MHHTDNGDRDDDHRYKDVKGENVDDDENAPYRALDEDVRDFWVPREVKRLRHPITALTFLRDYVQPSIPVIFSKGSGLLDQWQGVERWKEWEWVVGRVGEETIVSVNVTPDGRGDAILEMRKEIERKVEEEKRPEERRMAFGAFVDILLHGEDEGGRESGREEGVFYLSQQNDNMRVDFPMFLSDGQGTREEGGEEGQVPAAGFPIARQVFGHAPDAINLWIGGRRSVSSVHKDPYENMYAVLKGEKHFTLFPPSDAASFSVAQDLLQATYHSSPSSRTLSVSIEDQGRREDGGRIDWIDLEASREGGREGGRALHPLEVWVKEGEVLYLPALWFHEVTQTCPTIAVNYWHDMAFLGPKYVYFNFMQRLGRQRQRRREGGREGGKEGGKEGGE